MLIGTPKTLVDVGDSMASMAICFCACTAQCTQLSAAASLTAWKICLELPSTVTLNTERSRVCFSIVTVILAKLNELTSLNRASFSVDKWGKSSGCVAFSTGGVKLPDKAIDMGRTALRRPPNRDRLDLRSVTDGAPLVLPPTTEYDFCFDRFKSFI